MGLRPCMPVPWRREIFSSSVISLRTRSARSSAERAGFIQGCVDFGFAAFEEDSAGRAKANRARAKARMLERRDVRVIRFIVFFRRDLLGATYDTRFCRGAVVSRKSIDVAAVGWA